MHRCALCVRSPVAGIVRLDACVHGGASSHLGQGECVTQCLTDAHTRSKYECNIFFKGRACSLSSKFVGSGTSHYSSLAQDAHQDCARVDTSLGTREDEIRILHHICDDIACCRMPWLVWVRPRSACKSTVCVLRARAAAGDMAARRVGHTCTQRSMPGAHGLET